jgi:hypothetical protein
MFDVYFAVKPMMPDQSLACMRPRQDWPNRNTGCAARENMIVPDSASLLGTAIETPTMGASGKP